MDSVVVEMLTGLWFYLLDKLNPPSPTPHPKSCLSEPNRKWTCRLRPDFLSGCLCRGGRGEFMQPYEELALPPCFHDNHSSTALSRGTEPACENGSPVVVCFFFFFQRRSFSSLQLLLLLRSLLFLRWPCFCVKQPSFIFKSF